MDGPRDYHTKWSKSKIERFPLSEVSQKEKDLYVQSKIWHKWTYLWNSNRLTDPENGLVVAKGEGRSESLGLADVSYYI